MKLTVEVRDEDQLEEKIKQLGRLNSLGLDYELFWDVVHNLNNGVTSPTRRNKFDIKGWVEFYNSYKIELEEELLETFFEYLSKYYSHILIKETKTEFIQLLPNNISIDESPFGLETIVLKSMEINE